jgi:programmed cell death 6-interacting protein
MKEAIIAKLASQCEEFYAETLKQMKQPATTSVWERDWNSKVTGKQLAYHAIAQYYQSRVCNSRKAVGEEIARLQVVKVIVLTNYLK